jgi:hypothetical protein
MPHSGFFIAGAFGEEISQTVILESDESNQILPSLSMGINSNVTIFTQDLEGDDIGVPISGIDMSMQLGSFSIDIQEPVDAIVPPASVAPLRMSMTFRPATPETVSFELPPGKWKKPKKNLPRGRPWNTLGEYEDTEYEVGIDFAPIVARSGWWTVSSITLRDTILIRSEASISQDPSIEGRP